MPRVSDHQPHLFPMGDMGPPQGPVGTALACPDGDDDVWEDIMVALAWAMVRAYAEAHLARNERGSGLTGKCRSKGEVLRQVDSVAWSGRPARSMRVEVSGTGWWRLKPLPPAGRRKLPGACGRWMLSPRGGSCQDLPSAGGSSHRRVPGFRPAGVHLSWLIGRLLCLPGLEREGLVVNDLGAQCTEDETVRFPCTEHRYVTGDGTGVEIPMGLAVEMRCRFAVSADGQAL